MTVSVDILSGNLDIQNTAKIFGKMLTKKLEQSNFSDILKVRDAFTGCHFLSDFRSLELLRTAILESRSVDAGKYLARMVQNYNGDKTHIIKGFEKYGLFPRFATPDTTQYPKEFLGAKSLDGALPLYVRAITSIKNISNSHPLGMSVFNQSLLTDKVKSTNNRGYDAPNNIERGDRFLKHLINSKDITLNGLYITVTNGYAPESLSAVDVLLGTGDISRAATKYGKIFGYAFSTGIITRNMLDGFFGTLFSQLSKSELYHLKLACETDPYCVGKHIEQCILCVLSRGKTDINMAYATFNKYELIHLMHIVRNSYH